MTTLVTNIKQLVGIREETKILRGTELANLPCITNAYLIIEDGEIAEYGEMQNSKFVPMAIGIRNSKFEVDAAGQFVLPAWCDSHTHLVFAASREEEFIDKIKGMSYAEIASKGGGILSSAKKLNDATEDELFNLAWKRLDEVRGLGTGAIEIKSGYG